MTDRKQEPVAWIYIDPKWKRAHVDEVDLTQIPKLDEWYPIYFKPQRQWVGLTKEEAKEISMANRPYVIDMIAALEARLKEKNT